LKEKLKNKILFRAEIDNDTKVINLWKEWAENLKNDFDAKCNTMSKEIERLSHRIEELEAENRKHLKTIENLITHGRGAKTKA
jgi:archaellum component FlaC